MQDDGKLLKNYEDLIIILTVIFFIGGVILSIILAKNPLDGTFKFGMFLLYLLVTIVFVILFNFYNKLIHSFLNNTYLNRVNSQNLNKKIDKLLKLEDDKLSNSKVDN